MRDLLKKIDNILLEDSRKENNFEVDDLQKLNDIEDLDTLKKVAFTLISTPSKKRMKDEKISWFKRQLEQMTNKDRIIKMMWDLYLSGEGDSVIGSRYSTDKNYYRKVFDDLEEIYEGDEFYEAYGELPWLEDEELEEAEYQGRKVKLGKPVRSTNGPKKFHVYVKNPKGNVVKVNFGDPDMKIKKSNPARRKSFRARHNCDNPGPRHKARFWSCKKW